MQASKSKSFTRRLPILRRLDKCERQAANRSGQKGEGSDQHEPLMGLWLVAVIERDRDQDGKHQDVK